MASVFVPLNSFKSVLSNLTGEQDQVYITPTGVSTIILSAQITNNSFVTQPVSIFIASNADIPVPDFTDIESTGSFISQSVLLNQNRQFIRKEVAAYVNFVNNLSETPFPFTASRFEKYALTVLDALTYDITNNTTLRTYKAAKSFYDKNGDSVIIDGEYSASVQTVEYVNKLAQQIIKNNYVSESIDVVRLYQTVVTQSFDSTYFDSASYSSSAYLINKLSNVVLNNIQYPNYVTQTPIQLVTNATIPAADSLSPVVSGKLVLEQGYGFVVSGSTELTVILSLLESANE
jgi:hypothetical protein